MKWAPAAEKAYEEVFGDLRGAGFETADDLCRGNCEGRAYERCNAGNGEEIVNQWDVRHVARVARQIGEERGKG